MDKVYKYIIQKTVSDRIDKRDAVDLLELLKQEKDKARQMDIAVIGIAAKTSRANNIREFWKNLSRGFDGVRDIPLGRQRDLDSYLRFRGLKEKDLQYKRLAYLDEIDKFDYEYFNLPPREAELMDPNQRLFLETACAAIEDAGYSRAALKGTKTGLYLGYITANYSYQNWLFEADAAVGASTLLGNMAALIPSRVSYLLDLRGPSILVDTTCSSSLVAIHLACQALRTRECEQAIVGGIKLHLLPLLSAPKIGIESSTERTWAFDEAGDGTGQGEGVGAVILKPLQQALRDGDNIQAVIKGSAINQDGQSLSLTAPNPAAQTEVIKAAWEAAQINPETVSYIEAHGTGTKLGDPIEIEGISKAFAAFTDKKQFCAVASVKSNIGHLDEAAGIFGLIKTVLALKNKALPASINFHEPNHKIDWLESPVFINDKLSVWSKNGKTPRRAGVSSFGLSGTNCHVVLEEAPSLSNSVINKDLKLFTLSARNSEALHRLAGDVFAYVKEEEKISLADLVYTLNTGRDRDLARLAFVFTDRSELLDKLENFLGNQKRERKKGIYFKVNKKRAYVSALNNTPDAILEIRDWQNTGSVSALENLAALFAQGVDLDWSIFYEAQKFHRISLPTYSFARERAWFKLPSAFRDENHFELAWRQADLVFEPSNFASVLFFKNSSRRSRDLYKQLRQEVGTKNIIVVEAGKKFQKLSANRFTLCSKQSDFDKLIKALSDRKLSHVIFAWSLSDAQKDPSALSELNNAINQDTLNLFHLAKALRQNYLEQIINLIIISEYVNEVTGQEKTIKPANAVLSGLGRGLFIEFLNWRLRVIDTDEETDSEKIVHEICSEYQNHKVAYRQGNRYIEEFRYHQEPEKKSIDIRPGGVYLFTGGTSGIVQELIKYLSRLEKIKIILLNRTKLPGTETWTSQLNNSANTVEQKKLFANLLAVQKNGSEIFSYSTDVSKEKELAKTLTAIKEKFGRINGVVHAAGVAREKEFDQKTADDFREVLAAKVAGTWLLDKYTRDQNLDFFSLLSSAITCFGGIFNLDYIAANSYLDAYAFWGRKQGINFSAVNWPFWDETGMHVRYIINTDKVPLKNISPAQGAEEWFNSLNNQRAGLVVIGELNYQGKTAHLIKHSPFSFAPEIVEQIERNISTNLQVKEREQVELRGYEQGGYSLIEKDIAQILFDVLGYKEINVSDNFFDLGGDSLFIAEIFSRLDKKFPGKLNITQLFTYPTVAKLAEYLNGGDNRQLNIVAPQREIRDIAVIGLAARTSLADDYSELWKNLLQGRECIREMPQNRRADIDNYLRAAGADEKYLVYSPLAYLSHIDCFDYEFFKFSPREAKLMDPSHRLFLETVITALETAGYGGEKLRGSNTGLYLGYGPSDFEYKNLVSNSKFDASTALFTGNLNALIPSRISYLLDLHGPSMVIDTACSSSLVAIHVACQALLSGDCEQAIAGGVRLNLVPLVNRFKIGIESSDWRTHTFDEKSDGTGMGEGVAALILKPLEKAQADGDQIWAVIKGSAVNQDGQSVGITAPNPRAQADVVAAAWLNAKINPTDISYIEVHGTGTNLGDPIEVEGITHAFRRFTDKKQFCAISAIKPNLGHTLESAGIFSFIKAVLSLRNKQLLPTINFHEPNHRVNWEESAVFVNDKLRSWLPEADRPRLCGVSSFGLSGTNCHIVISEYENNNSLKESGDRNIFTLSAKNEKSFFELIERHIKHLEKSTIIDWRALCYTANTGRGHYEYRLAIMANSTSELLEKLKLFKNKNCKTLANSGIYFGRHQLVIGRKSARKDYELSELTINELSKAAKAFVNKASKTRALNENFAMKIMEYYVQGALIDWEKLVIGEKPEKVNLPTYPFQKIRCWVDDYEESILAGQASNLQYLHPLLEKCLVKSQEQDIYQTVFSPKKHFVLGDHIINGSHVLPGTVYLEIAKQIGALYYGDIPLEIRNLNFITPVITGSDEKKEVQIVVKESGGYKKFYAMSQFVGEDKGQWLRHVEGEIYPRPDLFIKQVDLPEIIKRCQARSLDVDINKNSAGFIDFGLRWQNYHRISFGENEALAELSLPKECLHDLETYYLHPPMLDMAAAAVSMATGFKALPYSYGSCRVTAPLGKRIYSHFKRIGAYDEVEETVSFDLDLLDPQGRVLVEIENFKLKRTRDFTRVIKRNRGLKNDKFYKTVWENQELDDSISDLAQPAWTLVFPGETEQAKEIYIALKKTDRKIISIKFGQSFRALSENEFEIRNELSDYLELIKIIKDRPLEQVIHLGGLRPVIDIYSEKQMEDFQYKSVYVLFYLIKALTLNIVKRKVDIVLLSANAHRITGQEKLRPESATLVGFGKAPVLEDVNWRCRSLDVDEKTSSEKIIKEINVGYSAYKIAYRNNHRYKEIFKHYNINSAPEREFQLKSGSNYLISGGTGGMGLELAKKLVSLKKINLFLLNRTQLPPREDWKNLLSSTHPLDKKIKNIIEQVLVMEKSGSRVEVIKVDIADCTETKKVLDNIRARFGKFKGIFHAAGVPGGSFIAYKEEEAIKNTFAPKISGTLNLDKLTREDNLDFMVLFSSSTSIHSAPGQSDYTAANSFLDAFSVYRQTQGLNTLAVNWAGLRDVGMLSTNKTFARYGTLTVEAGLDSMLSVMKKKIDSLMIGSLAYIEGVFSFDGIFPLELSTEVKAELFQYSSKQIDRETHALVEVKIKGGGTNAELEKVLAQIWSEVLGVQEVDVNDHFFDLGGDSLRISEVFALLEKKYPGKFSVAELFAYPTIAELVKHVEGNNVDFELSEKNKNILVNQDIAIIGMASRTSLAESLTEFWENLKKGIDCIREIPEERKKDIDNYLIFRGLEEKYRRYQVAAYLEDIDKFDHEFFRISPREAELMDPNQRLLLETVYHALENAGYNSRRLNNSKTGLYVGFFPLGTKYYDWIAEMEPTALSEAMVNNMEPTIASRISYYLNLVGPSMLINTACSSSLVAIHLACQAIRNGDCEQAIVGSIKINLLNLLNNPKVGIESSDGHTRAFDNDSDGTGLGEGVAAVMLKPLVQALHDGDNVLAVIKGSAINQDGQSVGITAPNALSQTEVILSAWRQAGINPETISYFEAHGTGTNLGDPIEIEGLSSAFRKFTNKKQFCAISSVKSNLGHLLEAAGIFGLIKTVLALEKKQLPPTLNLHEPNTKVNWEDSPVYINNRLSFWENDKNYLRRAVVSSFGLSGTNSHVVLEEAPLIMAEKNSREVNLPQIFSISARSREQIKILANSFLSYFMKNDSLDWEDVCFTLNTGRDHHNHRLVFVAHGQAEAQKILQEFCAWDFDNSPGKSFYYGEFKIVPFGQKIKTGIEITEKEALTRGREIEMIMSGIIWGEEINYKFFEKICQDYAAGANFDWLKLYKDRRPRKLALPLYPFARTRAWLQVPGMEKFPDYYHQSKWGMRVLVGEKTQSSGPILILHDNQTNMKKVMKFLVDQGQELIRVKIGKAFQKINKNNFVIDNSLDSYKKLFAELQARPLAQIIHALSVETASPENLIELQSAQKKGIFSLMYLAQALAPYLGAKRIDLFMLTQFANAVVPDDKEIRPESAPMIGFGKAVSLEIPGLRCRAIDFGVEIETSLLWQEMQTITKDYRVAYRHSQRYIEELFRLDMQTVPERRFNNSEFIIRPSGVYLITGGTGGIGLEIAKQLAQRQKIKLVLLSRHGVPPRSEWNGILHAEGPKDRRLLDRIKSLETIENLGAELLILEADVANQEQFSEALKTVRQKFGLINGIIHAAGSASEGFIINKGTNALENTLAPKVSGTWLLGELTKDLPLDFMVLFSSAITMVSGISVSDYTAANSYLDAYADFASRQGRPVIAINWATWENIGLSYGESVDEKKQLLRILPIDTALSLFFNIISHDISRVAAGQMNHESDIMLLGDYLPLSFSEEIKNKIKRRTEFLEKQIRDVKLKGGENDNYTVTERELASIWCDVLGYKEIDIRDNFFELGGDSLSGIRLIARVNKHFDRSLSFREILQNPTLKNLAAFISQSEKVEYVPVIKKVKPKQYKIKL